MNVRSYCAEYQLLSGTKISHYLNTGVLSKGVLINLPAHNFVKR